eukprot:jgi/Picre1/27735/NNA_000699.t1
MAASIPISGLLAVSLSREPKRPRVRPCETIIIMTEQCTTRPYTVVRGLAEYDPGYMSDISLLCQGAKIMCSAAWYVYQQRPRGWSRQDLLCVRESSLGSGAGNGVFSKVAIPRDVVLGAYPGRVRNDIEMTAKCVLAPMAQYYCFSKKPGVILDPSDESGYPSTRPSPGTWWPWDVDCTLSYVNEPSLHARVSVNVRVEDDKDDPSTGLVFVTDRDIAAGEELFIDYGKDYDRSGYDVI